jgi:YD repeat-containing protein
LIVIEDNDTEAPIATCEYDALGRRISKVVANSGAWNATYKYFYDGHQVVEVQNGSDVIVKQNVWGVMYVDELVQIGVNDDTTDGSVDTFYSVLADANYNIIGIMDSDGDLIERREYMPYGQRKVFKKAASGDGDYHCSEATSPSGASQSRPRVRADAGSPEKPRFIQLSAKAIHSGKRSQRPTSGAELA